MARWPLRLPEPSLNDGTPRACWQVGLPDPRPLSTFSPTPPPKQEPRTACPRPQELSQARPPCTTNGNAWSSVPSTPSTTSCSSSSSARRLPMRSARGDHHPPQPLEKQGSQRRGNPPGSQSKAGAEPRGFLLPHPLPGLWDSETESASCACSPLWPQPQIRPHPFIWTLIPHSPLASQLLVYLVQSRLHRAPAMTLPLSCSQSSHGSPVPLAEVPSSAV